MMVRVGDWFGKWQGKVGRWNAEDGESRLILDREKSRHYRSIHTQSIQTKSIAHTTDVDRYHQLEAFIIDSLPDCQQREKPEKKNRRHKNNINFHKARRYSTSTKNNKKKERKYTSSSR